jgi:lycopene beta-cyclase
VSTANDVDIAIIGAGLAGLRLAAALREQRPELRVLLQGPNDTRQQRLSFWRRQDQPDPFASSIDARWNCWLIANGEQQIRHTSSRYEYVSMDGLHLRATLAARLEQSGCIRQRGLLHDLQASRHNIALQTDEGTVTAAWVLDTRPPSPAPGTLCQQFFGITLAAANGHGLSNPVLMNFDVAPLQSPGVYFLYVLPITPQRLLLEYTAFVAAPLSMEEFRRGLTVAIRQHYPELVGLPAESEESGLIPMGPVIPRAQGPRVIPCGVAGGAARAATGYAFSGIGRQIDALLAQFSRVTPEPALQPPSVYSWRAQTMDSIFLRVIRQEPERMADIITTMAKRLSADQFAEFLSDHGGWLPVLRTIWKVPKRPFLRAVLRL